MRLDLDEPHLDLGGAQRLGPDAPLGEQRGALDIGGERGLQRRRRAARGFLGEKADPVTARQFDRAGIGLQRTADQIEEGRLAGAVAPDEAHLAALGDLCAGLVEQSSPGDPVCHAQKGQHRGLLP
jgi:hypothetical protein